MQTITANTEAEAAARDLEAAIVARYDAVADGTATPAQVDAHRRWFIYQTGRLGSQCAVMDLLHAWRWSPR